MIIKHTAGRIALLATVLVAACTTVPKGKIEAKVDQRMTAAEAAKVEVKKDDLKLWLFEQTVKVRLTNSPSAKILKQIDEGAKVKAFVKPLGDGWFRIQLADGTDGFFFGNFAREVAK